MSRRTLEERKDDFQIGDIYLDVFFHPTLCLEIDFEDDDICLSGVSLYDGTYPRCCSVMHSAPEKITKTEAWKMKLKYEKSKRPKRIRK